MDKYFTNTVSRVGGITIRDIQNDLEARHKQAFDPLGLDINMELTSLGEHKLRSGKLAEDHLYNPLTIHLLQQACWTGDYQQVQGLHRCRERRGRRCHAPAQPAGLQLS